MRVGFGAGFARVDSGFCVRLARVDSEARLDSGARFCAGFGAGFCAVFARLDSRFCALFWLFLLFIKRQKLPLLILIATYDKIYHPPHSALAAGFF